MTMQSGLLAWLEINLFDLDMIGQLAAVDGGAEQRFSNNLLHVPVRCNPTYGGYKFFFFRRGRRLGAGFE